MVTQWQQRRLGQLVGKWSCWRSQSGAGRKRRSSMLLPILLLGVLPVLHVCSSEEVTVDTDACLRGAKARHGDNPNDELDSFLACVLARLDAVSFPHSQFGW